MMVFLLPVILTVGISCLGVIYCSFQLCMATRTGAARSSAIAAFCLVVVAITSTFAAWLGFLLALNVWTFPFAG